MAAKHSSRNGRKRHSGNVLIWIPAVGYIRMSSDKQEASPSQQKAEILKFAEREGYTIVRWYEDDGIAGWKDTREAFQRLIDDAETRKDFEAILVWDQNRFSRFPPVEACYYWHRLDKANVHLASVNQGRIEWGSIAGFLTATIRQHADSEHRFKLSADVKRGQRARAERGLWIGRPPFAYVLVDGRLVVGDSIRVELVRRLFAEYLEGRSLRGIARRLNDEGLVSLNDGRPWIAAGVRDKLANPAYAGIFRLRGVEIPANHPAIVSMDDFDRVQELLSARQRQTTPVQDGGGFLFTRLLKCGACGSPMSGRDSSRHYYKCRGAMDAGSIACDGNTVKQADLYPAVVEGIEEHWMNPKVVKALRDELHRQVDKDRPVADPGRLARQLTTVEAKLTKAKRRLIEVDADMLLLVQEHIRELRQQQEQLQQAVEASRTPRDAMYADADERVDRAVKLFSTLSQTLREADPVHVREFFREAVQHIKVWTSWEMTGRKRSYRLERGSIALKGDNLSTPSG
ncbi:MAG: recombinase family protein [Planctomycetes bacterium]|nr:recombinase family protein [Planctomycetota bacterium]